MVLMQEGLTVSGRNLRVSKKGCTKRKKIRADRKIDPTEKIRADHMVISPYRLVSMSELFGIDE